MIGALVLEPPGRGTLPHERTTPKAKSDRLELMRATEANTSPIWCLCSHPGLTAAVGLPPSARGPAGVAAAHDNDDVLHEIWPLLGGEVYERVAEVVGAGPLLVADGHHRYETALAYQAERLALQASGLGAGGPSAGGPSAGGYDSIMSLVVELSEEQLDVRPIHRLVSGLPAGFDVLQALAGAFELEPASAHGEELPAEMASAGALGAVTAGGCWLARPRPGHSGDSVRAQRRCPREHG